MSGKKRRNSDTSTNSSSSSLKKRKSNDGAKSLSINVVDQRTKSSASNKKSKINKVSNENTIPATQTSSPMLATDSQSLKKLAIADCGSARVKPSFEAFLFPAI